MLAIEEYNSIGLRHCASITNYTRYRCFSELGLVPGMAYDGELITTIAAACPRPIAAFF
jgi:hypothetical protein